MSPASTVILRVQNGFIRFEHAIFMVIPLAINKQRTGVFFDNMLYILSLVIIIISISMSGQIRLRLDYRNAG